MHVAFSPHVGSTRGGYRGHQLTTLTMLAQLGIGLAKPQGCRYGRDLKKSKMIANNRLNI
jgi:hypothetical protein